MAGLNFYRRDTYIGRTDQYLTSALSGYAVFDPLRDYFAIHHRDDTVTRLRRYHRNWRFYNGMQYTIDRMEGEKKLQINYCRPIVNKSADWLFGKGFTVRCAEGNELLAKLLMRIWQDNSQQVIAWRAAMIGGVTGDAYFFVSVPWMDEYGRPIPQDNQRIMIQALNSSYVHPKFSGSERHEVVEALIQYPVDSKTYRSIIGSKPTRDLCIYSQYVSPTEIREFINEQEFPNSPRPNPMGIVPLIHIQNLPHPGFFGIADVDDIVDVQEQYNETAESIRKIIKYHAEPTTIIYGAKVSELVRGASKVWSGLPIDARVENLALDANLLEASNYREALKLALHELSCTPEQSLGKIQPISNTSNAALETAYMPLIEKTQRKRITYGCGLRKVNRLILMYLQAYFGVNLEQFGSNMGSLYETTIDFPSPLPSDEEQLVRGEVEKLQNNLQSEAGAMEKIYGEKSTSKAIEILADKREKLLRDSQSLVSAEGGVPNLAVHSVGSLALIPGVAEVFEGQNDAMDKAVQQQAKQEREAQELEEERARLKGEEAGMTAPGKPTE